MCLLLRIWKYNQLSDKANNDDDKATEAEKDNEQIINIIDDKENTVNHKNDITKRNSIDRISEERYKNK